MGVDGQPHKSGQNEADNVIRFPRDWFGSTEDLTPIGSAADRLEEEAAAVERMRTSALSANDFWGEGSGALHQAVDVPGFADEVRLAPLEVSDGGAQSLPVYAAFSRGLAWLRMPRVHHRLGAPRAALVLAAMVIAALALFLVGGFGPSSGTSRVVGTEAAGSVKTEGAVPMETSQENLVSVRQSALRSATQSHVGATSRTGTARHAVRKSQRTKPVVHRVIRTRAKAVPKTETSSPRPVTSELSTTPVTEAASTVSSSTRSSEALSDSSVAPVAAGPSTPGSAGPDCDPQCT